MASAYGVTAQYYDPLTATAHAETERRIEAALAGLDCAHGPVVDVGAGTGFTSVLIARTLPAAEILAVEPDPAMRPSLMTRVWSDPELRRRVTILPFEILAAPLPAQISGAVLSASLVHLAPSERTALWASLGGRLAASGRILVEVQCPQADDLEEAEAASAQVGRMTYRAWASARRVADDRQRWRMTYSASLDGVELVRETTSFDCWNVSADAIVAEAAQAGLAGAIQGDLVILSLGQS